MIKVAESPTESEKVQPEVTIADIGHHGNPDTQIAFLQSQLALKDATIEAKTATIETLNLRLQTSNSHVQESITKFQERPPSSAEVIAEIRNLQKSLSESQAPLLEFQPSMLVVNPIGRAQSRVFAKFLVKNLGAPTSLYAWQAQVRLRSRSIHLVQGLFNQNQLPDSGSGLGGVNLVIDDRVLQKGEGRVGWVEFVTLGDPRTDGEVLDVRRIVVTVADYTQKRYDLELPPYALDLPPRLPPASPGEPPTVRIETLGLPKRS